MNINRNVLKMVAGVLLVASLPAGAQLLGGGASGAVNGALGGGVGQGIHGSGGVMGGGSIDAPDAAGTVGKVRDRTQQAGKHARDATVNGADAARSRVEKTRGTTDAAAQATTSAGASAGHGAAGTATQSGNGAVNGAATSTTSQEGGVLLDGASSAGMEKHALGRDVSANSGASSDSRADRSGISNSTSGQADASVKKSGPTRAQATPAQ